MKAEIDPNQAQRVTKRLVEIGAEQIGIADTIGVGTPLKVQRALQAALEYVEISMLSVIFIILTVKH